jgi:polysaccharide pyruvyl transferase WcaK-like protein
MGIYSYYTASPRKILTALKEHYKSAQAGKKVLPWDHPPVSFLDNKKEKTNPRLTHIGVFAKGNAGDHLLPITLRDLFDKSNGAYTWQLRHARPECSLTDIEKINTSSGAIIGGGGLFLRDTNANQNSGWQWNCSIADMRAIEVPVALFAVGYNRFRGQPDFDPVFTQHLSILAEKSVYIGLRNSGSIRAVKNYLPENLHHKLRYQPCMTTLIQKLYPELCASARRSTAGKPIVAINMAFDRARLRYQDREIEVLTNVAGAMRQLSRQCEIHMVIQGSDDGQFTPFMRTQGIPFEKVDLRKCPPEDIVRYYTKVDLAIGMRGHAQMIPFGCGTAILSLISHDKVRWFLDDIGQTKEWGIELLGPDVQNELITKAEMLLSERAVIQNKISKVQNELWNISLKNTQDFKNALKC